MTIEAATPTTDPVYDGIVDTLRSLRFRAERRADRVWIEAAGGGDVVLVTRTSATEWLVRLIDKVHKRELARRTVDVRRDATDDPAWIGSMVATAVNRMQREYYRPDDGRPRRRRRR